MGGDFPGCFSKKTFTELLFWSPSLKLQTRKGPIKVQSYSGAFIDHNIMTAYQKL